MLSCAFPIFIGSAAGGTVQMFWQLLGSKKYALSQGTECQPCGPTLTTFPPIKDCGLGGLSARAAGYLSVPWPVIHTPSSPQLCNALRPRMVQKVLLCPGLDAACGAIAMTITSMNSIDLCFTAALNTSNVFIALYPDHCSYE